MINYVSLRKLVLLTALTTLLCSATLLADIEPQTDHPGYGSYVVVASKQTNALPQWKAVIDTLRTKYDASVIIYEDKVSDTVAALTNIMPKYICFVQQPEHAGIEFVTAVQRLTRNLDEDPYTDAMWGILTGYEPADALRIANRTTPLTVKNALSGTEKITLNRFEQGFLYNELEAGGRYVKRTNKKIVKKDFPVDSTRGLVRSFNKGPDAFFTSGHGTTTGWQIGYNYKDGFFKSKDGKLFGKDTKGKTHEINSPNSKVYLPTGNCLIGNIPKKDCFALAMMHSGGVDQMFGYTVVTFFGYMGWGTSTYFIDMPGQYSLTESFYANQQALLYQIETKYPKFLDVNFDDYSTGGVRKIANAKYPNNFDAYGMLWDRDAIAFYGDPAWKASLPKSDRDWNYSLKSNDNNWTLTVETLKDGTWPDRPLVAFFPNRVVDSEVMTGEEYMPRITDNFILVPFSGKFKADQKITITFKAFPTKSISTSVNAAPIVPDKALAASDNANLTLPNNVSAEYKSQVTEALTKAKDNAPQLINAIKKAPPAHTEAVCFLIANMPNRDLTSLTADYILENVEWAYKAKEASPWADSIPHDIFLNDILPYSSINERRDNWRKDFYERFKDVVKDCKTPGEAAIALNYNIWKMTNVKYSTKRRKADQSPYETMEQGLASCTGLSVLYIDACRAHYVPARFAGIPQWTTKRGNHSWPEVWDDGWHFTGAFEPAAQLDKGWFSADASKADPTNPMHCVYATSFKKTDTNFPCVWNLSIRYVSAVDVTDRYIGKEKTANGKKVVAISLRDKFQGKRITADVTVLKDGKKIGSGKTKTETNDTNDFLEFQLAPNSKYTAEITYNGKTVVASFATTQKDRQTIDFTWENLETKLKGQETCEL